MRTNLLLSICVPTFNRVDKVLYLLDIIKREIEGLEKDIEVIVSDNHTEPEQLQKLVEYSKENAFLKLYLQKENTGFSGNYHFLIEKSIGRYTWILGDDDIITEGSLKHIAGILKENISKIGCLHLRYNHFINSVHNIIPSIYDYGGIYGFIPDVEEYFRFFSGKGLISRFLFISANIFNSKKLKSIMILKEKRDLSDPLYYSLMCSKYGLFIDNYITLSQNVTKGATSWKSVARDVFLYITPSTIISIPNSYLPNTLKKDLVFNYFKNTYLALTFLLRMTSKRNVNFFKSIFTSTERLRIYTGNIVYIVKKMSNKILK